jgi:RNA polymerase sigma factor (sigma-70 family)
VQGASRGAGRVAGLYADVSQGASRSDRPFGFRRSAVVMLAAREAAIRRTAHRYSICADDAEDAYQRAVEILLVKAPDRPAAELAAWMQVVTRREALAVRRSRERLLATGEGDPAERLTCERPGPLEHAERRERVAAAGRALAALKPQERLAIFLQANGYTYAEICELCDWTYRKLNRCLAEGRARLRQLGAIA